MNLSLGFISVSSVCKPRKKSSQQLCAVIPAEQWERLCRNEGVFCGKLWRYEPNAVSIVAPPQTTELHITPRAVERDSTWVVLRKPGERDAVQFYSQALDAAVLAQRGMVYAEDGSFCSGSVQARTGDHGLSALIVEQNINYWEAGSIAGRRRVVVHYKGQQLSGLSLYREIDQSDYTESRPRAIDFVRLIETGSGAWVGRAEYIRVRDQQSSLWLDTEASLRLDERAPNDDEVAAVETRVAVPGFERVSHGYLYPDRNKIIFDPIHPHLQYVMHLLGRECTVLAPSSVPMGHPFFVEFTWLVRPGLRRRIVRQYDSDGAYEGSVFIAESKTS